ncbi:hypothetical protein AABB24_003316 [Solanum stoloniferum]|uniref:Uncharacterized protein n=1 Tax=Solanum stoloniferum TaxID=62892 RepID=A0ABD2VAY4_9SOLN
MTPASFFFFSANPDANQQYHRFQQPKSRPETSQQSRKRTASSRHTSVLLSPSGMSQNLKGKVFSRKGERNLWGLNFKWPLVLPPIENLWVSPPKNWNPISLL